MSKPGSFFLIVLSCLLPLGCTPKVVVRKSTGVHDPGIKYYRPKPYLLITPQGSAATVEQSSTRSTTTTIQSDQFVSIELQYLPDFSEEYSIDVRPGLGNADVSLTLDQGWNLTALNQSLDSQFDENLSAVADVVKAAGSVVPTGGDRPRNDGFQPEQMTRRWVVQATNVPLGYYEAVIAKDCGEKKLCGWRYVGFAPFNGCSAQLQSMQCQAVGADFDGAVYGLVFDRGVMAFRQLNLVQAVENPSHRTEVNFGTTTYRASSSEERIRQAIAEALNGESVRSTPVNLESIERISTPFPGTIHFAVVTSPPLTQRLKDKIKKQISEMSGLPPKVQLDFN